jgi:NAD(P)H-hydrate epimerase
MARLTGLTRQAVGKSRLKIARDFARRFECVLVLKGHHTIVASPSGKTYVNTTGNSGMATAGSGDVLTGMIAALLGQGIKPFDSAKIACRWHGLAGDYAAKKTGKLSLIAADLIGHIGIAAKDKLTS